MPPLVPGSDREGVRLSLSECGTKIRITNGHVPNVSGETLWEVRGSVGNSLTQHR